MNSLKQRNLPNFFEKKHSSNFHIFVSKVRFLTGRKFICKILARQANLLGVTKIQIQMKIQIQEESSVARNLARHADLLKWQKTWQTLAVDCILHSEAFLTDFPAQKDLYRNIHHATPTWQFWYSSTLTKEKHPEEILKIPIGFIALCFLVSM